MTDDLLATLDANRTAILLPETDGLGECRLRGPEQVRVVRRHRRVEGRHRGLEVHVGLHRAHGQHDDPRHRQDAEQR